MSFPHSYEAGEYNQLGTEPKPITPLDTALLNRIEQGYHHGFGAIVEANKVNTYNQNLELYDAETQQPIDNAWLSSKNIKEQYGIDIQHNQKLTKLSAEQVVWLKARDLERRQISANEDQNPLIQVACMHAEAIGSLLDPAVFLGIFVFVLIFKSFKKVLLITIAYAVILSIISNYYLSQLYITAPLFNLILIKVYGCLLLMLLFSILKKLLFRPKYK